VPQHDSRVALVTGTSSGIGEAVARELLRRGWRVTGVARRRGAIEHSRYAHISVDLADLRSLVGIMDREAGSLIADPQLTRLALVNNAADPGLLGPIEQLDPHAFLEVCSVNVAAPIWLMGWLLRRSGTDVSLRFVNVSSGAAVQPFPGLGAYCSTKAALRMAGLVLAAELDAGGGSGSSGRDATILSYEPGTVDTPMQARARATPIETLPTLALFTRVAAEGRLIPPAAPAGEIAEYLDGDGHARFEERRFAGSPRLSG